MNPLQIKNMNKTISPTIEPLGIYKLIPNSALNAVLDKWYVLLCFEQKQPD